MAISAYMTRGFVDAGLLDDEVLDDIIDSFKAEDEKYAVEQIPSAAPKSAKAFLSNYLEVIVQYLCFNIEINEYS